jgi:hypothetical protein
MSKDKKYIVCQTCGKKVSNKQVDSDLLIAGIVECYQCSSIENFEEKPLYLQGENDDYFLKDINKTYENTECIGVFYED